MSAQHAATRFPVQVPIRKVTNFPDTQVEAFRKKGGPLVIAVAPNVAAAKVVTEVAEALRDDIDFAYVRDGGLVTEVRGHGWLEAYHESLTMRFRDK